MSYEYTAFLTNRATNPPTVYIEIVRSDAGTFANGETVSTLEVLASELTSLTDLD